MDGGYDEAHAEARRLAEAEGFTGPRLRPARGGGRPGDDRVSRSRQAPDVKLVVVPLGGGGGLASGVGLALDSALEDVRVVGVQAEACAPYIDSLAAHRPIGARSANTICDGIAVKRPSDFTLPLSSATWTRSGDGLGRRGRAAMVILLERTKLVVGGAPGGRRRRADARPRGPRPEEGSVCAVLSGGNVDVSLLSEAIRLGETAAGRRMVLSTVVRTGRARWPACCGWSRTTAATSSTSSTCATGSRSTCARRPSSSCFRPAAARTARRSSTPPAPRVLGQGREGRLTSISPEVAEALAEARPVVALESAIVTTACRGRGISRWRGGRRGAGRGRCAGDDRGLRRARRVGLDDAHSGARRAR